MSESSSQSEALDYDNRLIPPSGSGSRRKSSGKRFAFHSDVISGLVGLLDILIVVTSGMLIYRFYLGGDTSDLTGYLSATLLAGMLVFLEFYFLGFYKIENVALSNRIVVRLLPAYIFVFMLMTLFAFSLKISDVFSRVWFFSWFAASGGLIVLSRYYYRILIKRLSAQGKLARRVVVLGGGEQGKRVIEKLSHSDTPWLQVMGYFDDRVNRCSGPVGDCPYLGNTDALIRQARNNLFDDIVLALPWTSEKRLRSLLAKLEVLPHNISLAPDLAGISLSGRECMHYGGVPMKLLKERPIDGWRQLGKFLEDKLLASFILLIISPVMLLIAALVKLDSPGPVFFRQRRLGFNNEIIEVLKFRTMYVDRESADAEVLATRNDPRITRVGRFLRRTSLDELPQFINVLRNEMSIVGPRPHALKAKAAGQLYDEVVKDYAKRHRVKPGITGWAQVNGWRGETDTEEKIEKRVQYDIEYIEKWSILFDLKIIVRTIIGGFTHENAY